MNFKSYPTSKATPSRKSRKSSRSSVFAYNRKLAKLAKRPRGNTQVAR